MEKVYLNLCERCANNLCLNYMLYPTEKPVTTPCHICQRKAELKYEMIQHQRKSA